ncbi:MAG: hypothetical protein RLZZ568_388 [Cyanobacteriota bacterium]
MIGHLPLPPAVNSSVRLSADSRLHGFCLEQDLLIGMSFVSQSQSQPSNLHRDRLRLSWWLGVILSVGFSAVAVFTYHNAITSARKEIVESTLPLTLDALSTDLQQQFVRPILFSSVMAANTFLIDWQRQEEENALQIQEYLRRVQVQHGATTAFFVSDKTGLYYHPSGVIKTVSPHSSQDAWYYHLRASPDPYKVNTDVDTADLSSHTVFVNYKFVDKNGNFLGATGLGMSTNLLSQRIKDAEADYGIQVMFVDPKGKIIFSSQPQAAMYLRLSDVAGLNPYTEQILTQALSNVSYREQGQEIFVRSKKIPELNWILLVSTPVTLPNGYLLDSLREIIFTALLTLGLALYLVFDVTNRYHQKLEKLAFTDPLSGALNRTAFSRLFQELVSLTSRRQQFLAIALLDIDFFKTINDRYGHNVGDEVIKAVAQTIRHCIRKEDQLFRWGGEEFLLLLPNVNLAHAQHLMERITPAIAINPVEIQGERICPTLSIGVTIWQTDDSVEAVLERADQALYAAKAGGRNQTVCR